METMDLEKLLRVSRWEKDKVEAWCQSRGKLVSREESLHIAKNVSEHFTGENGTKKMMASDGQDNVLTKIAQLWISS